MKAMHIDGVEELVPQIVERVQRADEKVVSIVRERPLLALATAIALGYVVGRVVSRLG